MTDTKFSFDRRSLLLGGAAGVGALSLGGCMATDGMSRAEAEKWYGAVSDKKFDIPPVDVGKIDPKYYRRTMAYPSKEAPGTIIVDPSNYYVYRIEGDGMATRYGANVGRQGFLWSGDAYVGRKAEWPGWTPPAAMLKRRPDLPRHMAGGVDNPLGARAMYLYSGNRDVGYRIHGSNEPDTIGQAVSSGCIRMLNADVEDLYERVRVGAKVVVLR